MSRTDSHVPAWVQAIRDKRTHHTVVMPDNPPQHLQVEDEEYQGWYNRTNGEREWMYVEYDKHFHRGKMYGEYIEYIRHPKRVLATNKFRAAAKRVWRAEVEMEVDDED